jgi:hypothetical protein
MVQLPSESSDQRELFVNGKANNWKRSFNDSRNLVITALN